MIIARIRGGLGNQMFQYAFARSEAKRLNTSLILDLSWYRKADRIFRLDCFNVSYRLGIRSRLVTSIVKTFMPRAHIYDGFWEDQKYAASIRDTLLQELTLKQPSKRFQELSAALMPNSIAIHVRRGDYLGSPDKHVLGYNYYDTAIKRIVETKKLSNPRITIFSDDKEWCRQEMKTLGGLPTEIFEDPAILDAEELMLMSRYGHNIIGNSTFSWWAAFLNQNASKMVIAPQAWYTDPARNNATLKALILPDWTVIQ